MSNYVLPPELEALAREIATNPPGTNYLMNLPEGAAEAMRGLIRQLREEKAP